jgi:hypothetical protein
MPQSNKRTTSLPSSHPVGLRSCSSTLLGPPPHRLCQATAPCWIHALPPIGSRPLRLCLALTPWQIHTPPGHHLLGHARYTLLGPPVFKPPTSQVLLGPSSMWYDQSHALPESLPLGARHQLGERQASLSPSGSTPFGQNQAPALQASQITTPPGSCLGCH